MITPMLARALKHAGLAWRPQPGDRFIVARDEMGDEVFHLAELVVEAHELETGTILAFNGTTEWALDSVAVEDTVWLPTEAQLRAALGVRFVALERMQYGYRVVTDADGVRGAYEDPDAESAYARALLGVGV